MNQFLTVWPSASVARWEALEKRSDDAFNAFYGPDQTAAAAQIGRELSRRTVFGWLAAREKLLAAVLKIDDVSLELAKIALLRADGAPPANRATEMRLQGRTAAKDLLFTVIETGTEAPLEQVTVAASLIAEIEADADGWQALRGQLTAGSFVDVQRILLETTIPHG
jgi:hypothetical protein